MEGADLLHDFKHGAALERRGMSNAARVLLIEADDDLSGGLIIALENEGYKPQVAKNCSQAAVFLRSLRFDAVVSEVSLPDGDVEQIYRDTLPFLGSTPIIFTSFITIGWGQRNPTINSSTSGPTIRNWVSAER